jgi:hypothetical protein
MISFPKGFENSINISLKNIRKADNVRWKLLADFSFTYHESIQNGKVIFSQIPIIRLSLKKV